MKYIYFIRYSIGGSDGMLEYFLDREITTYDDVLSISRDITKNLPVKARRGDDIVLIDNYILLRTESED